MCQHDNSGVKKWDLKKTNMSTFMGHIFLFRKPFELSEDDFEDSIVNEVSRRVLDRLNKENRKTKMVDELAERIMNRLANNKSS